MIPNADVLIIGAGMSGLGLAIQMLRKYNLRTFEIYEKTHDVGGTWLVNTYPGCGCDVASHFYSYSFALNPDWSQKFSLRSEIQAYFRNLAEQYGLIPHIRFHHTVDTARWNEAEQLWEVAVKEHSTNETSLRRARVVVSAVGSLSIPKSCEIPGADMFKGPLFHSAQWEHSFEWKNKQVVVLGNGCSATQFVPAMSETTGQLTQFARQPHYLAERPNPSYGPAFKAVMRYVPLAMRLYRFMLYADMEKDFAGFDIQSGARLREDLRKENEDYVKKMAPEKYWDALMPKHEIGCKRKVMDTDYLACLYHDNVELIHDDPAENIIEDAVLTRSGRVIKADAIILATGFEVFRMLHPMEIIGADGITLNEYWNSKHQGAAQAYLGTSVPGFKNFFTMMGPNTITGHLSVIYTVECQINFVLRLIEPILKTAHSSDPSSAPITSVDVKAPSAVRDSQWVQAKLKNLVWSSGCTSWALDPQTGLNIAMYPQYQFYFWLRTVFIPSGDFDYEYRDGNGLRKKQIVVGGWKALRQTIRTAALLTLVFGGLAGVERAGGVTAAREVLVKAARRVIDSARQMVRT
ncbi:hypothetical protein DOTSEDRAFT_49642 [Dothistroma septosporum NZE10]|uniref:Uncharacterized protein n=1 Tax=Dothistroma septosporum (strain NZE10 / CBS 128990) TaxID=675120 RepID=N1Q0R0_DOTSN|nr:hypothetical protein DOTSEDRAFT_49642 [Dothistroma septosporum NZE10]